MATALVRGYIMSAKVIGSHHVRRKLAGRLASVKSGQFGKDEPGKLETGWCPLSIFVYSALPDRRYSRRRISATVPSRLRSEGQRKAPVINSVRAVSVRT